MAGLRLAVCLPSLPAGAPHDVALAEVVGGLVRRGDRVEAFAEHDRLSRPFLDVPLRHYLRFPERHAREPFHVALYPFGRDAGSYQATLGMMRRFPGVVWVLDPILHHLVVGGLLLADRLGAYYELLEGAHGDRAAAIMETVVSGWGTTALFRHRDLGAALLGDQPTVLASSAPLAARMARQLGRRVADVPLPSPAMEKKGGGATGAGSKMTVVSANLAFPRNCLDGLEALLRELPELELTVRLPEVVYRTSFRPDARARGVDSRVHWILRDDWATVEAAVAASDVVAFLQPEPTAAERSLLDAAVASGHAVMVASAPLYGDVPDGVVAKIPVGRALPETLAAVVARLLGDAEFAGALRTSAAEYGTARPDAGDCAHRLAGHLAGAAATVDPTLRPVGRRALQRAREELGGRLPDGAGAAEAAAVRTAVAAGGVFDSVVR